MIRIRQECIYCIKLYKVGTEPTVHLYNIHKKIVHNVQYYTAKYKLMLYSSIPGTSNIIAKESTQPLYNVQCT